MNVDFLIPAFNKIFGLYSAKERSDFFKLLLLKSVIEYNALEKSKNFNGCIGAFAKYNGVYPLVLKSVCLNPYSTNCLG